jgi:myxalamid-type polyketide synthase MxaB
MKDLGERLASLSPEKRRLLEQRLRENREAAEPIAIVGMACRFPGAPDLESYWRLIRDGVDATRAVPPARWDPSDFELDGDEEAENSVRFGGFLDDVEGFDGAFFGITPRESAQMDPQQRLLLEVAWESLEHAGLPQERINGSMTGVFVGIGGSDYAKIPMRYDNYLEYLDAHAGTGNALSIAANRVSYLLNLHGPSIATDTACSSSLVSLHLALQSLRNWECDTAVAGGVNLILLPLVSIAFAKARMLSPSGRCRPFDAGADGYVRGEGCGLVVLRRLIDAVGAGDNVLAVIRGSAVNQDGRTSGITAPSAHWQRAAIRAALREADLTAGQVTYVEAHGTGTPLGDPLEAQSLGDVFGRREDGDLPCYLGSVKANIGHLETASGVAGLIKVVLMMQHDLILPQLHLEKLNPHLSLAGTRLSFPDRPIRWSEVAPSRIAGVSSFGFGGTNAHVVVEEARPRRLASPDARSDRPLNVLALSATCDAALKRLTEKYAGLMSANPEQSLHDLCYSANTGRSHFSHRLAATASSREEMHRRLASAESGTPARGVKKAKLKGLAGRRVAFLFSGQGSQYAGVGKELFETEPSFRRILEECDEILRDELSVPLLSVLFDEGPESSIAETAHTQPALFALEYALASLWRGWGIEPSILLGHSIGEYVAACLSGVFDLADGLKLIARRARLMQGAPGTGAMAAIFAPPSLVEPVLSSAPDRVAVAAVNGPQNTVISGDAETVERLIGEFERGNLRTRLLRVSHAFHSPLMEPVLDEFERLAGQMSFRPPRIPMVSNLTGRLLDDGAPEANYWRRHLRGTVRFADGMRTLAEQRADVFLEIGPSADLLAMGRQCLPDASGPWLPSLRKGRSDWDVLLGSLTDLYLLGANVDWSGFDRDWPRNRITLPTYPFQRTRHWIKEPDSAGRRVLSAGAAHHPLLGRRVDSALETTIFEVRLSSRSPRYLEDHQAQGMPVLPAAAYLEQAFAAAETILGPGMHAVEDVSIQQPLVLSNESRRLVQMTVSPETGGACSFQVHSIPADAGGGNARWTLHAVGRLRHIESTDAKPEARTLDLDEIRSSVIGEMSGEEFYDRIAAHGFAYGPAFRVLRRVQRTPLGTVAELHLPPEVDRGEGRYTVHPAVLDGCFQAMAGAVPSEEGGSEGSVYMPTGVRRVVRYAKPGDRLFAFSSEASVESGPLSETLKADVSLVDEAGQVLIELLGVQVRRLRAAAGTSPHLDPESWLYRLDWQPQPLPREAREPIANDANGMGRWLIFADRTGLGESLARRIHERGGECVLVEAADDLDAGEAGESRPRASEARRRIDPLAEDDYRRVLEHSLGSARSGRLGVVHLWSLDGKIPEGRGEQELRRARRLGCGSVLQLVRQLARLKLSTAPELWLVTRGAQAVGDAAEPVAVSQAPVWGLGRVVAQEHPELRSRLLDIDPGVEASMMAPELEDELRAPDDENQIAYRGGERRVARLRAAPELLSGNGEAEKVELSVPRGSPFRLAIGRAGSLESLRPVAFARAKPDDGQVEIEVHSAGLNFSDVLKAMGLYPDASGREPTLGIECSGQVTAVGGGVERFRVGDRVMGIAPFSFASHAVTAESALVEKPPYLSDDEACTIPIAFLTAYFGLCRLARLQAGERVLIHAGAGGVGLAAIQIAQQVGARIFATAGSETKREYLRSLGIEQVMNSRTLDFAEEILRVTDRRGVDVVLNSLPGDAISRSLSVLGPYGRFLEIGKTDIYQNRLIGLLPFQNGLSYFAIDLDRMLRDRPEELREMLAEIMERFDRGAYRPLNLTRFAIGETVQAFRFMAQRRNIGKVVVSLAESESPEDRSSKPLVADEGAYLITGGLGALGLQIAGWLVAEGKRRLVLLSRRGPSREVSERIDAMRRAGVQVAVLRADVTHYDSLAGALAQRPAGFSPLVGVIHAAGVVDDGVLFDMDLARLDNAMAPKVQGAWNVHAATVNEPLQMFLLFSSVAGVLGSPGQGNYASGNAFLDALAAYRRSCGLPATAVDWGPWAGSGMAVEEGRAAALLARGLDPLPPAGCFRILTRVLRAGVAHAVVLSARWGRLLRAGGGTPPILRDVARRQEVEESGDAEDQALRQSLLGAAPPERKEILADFFSRQLAEIMGLEPGSLDREQPLNTLGLDSLMALELKNTIERRLKIVVPLARFMEGPSVSTLAEMVASDLLLPHAPAARRESPASPASEDGRQPLSYGQRALWSLYRLPPELSRWASTPRSLVVSLRGPLNVAALQTALEAIVARHAIFRSSFHEEDGRPYQRIHDPWPVRADFEDASDWSQERIDQRLSDVLHRPFELETGPSLRASVLRRREDEHLIVGVMHPIVSDFWSLVLCAGEFEQLYAAARDGKSVNLPELDSQYGDFTRWQVAMLEGEEGRRHWEYWREELSGELPVLHLPTDRPRPPVQSFHGARSFYWLSDRLTGELRGSAEKRGTTLHVVLLAAYQALLHRYAEQDEILVGVTTSGRTRARFARVAGYFINPVVIRGRFSSDPEWSDFLEQIRGRMLAAIDHQDYPIGLLVERLQKERDPSRPPLFQVMFDLQKAQISRADRLTSFLMGAPGKEIHFAGMTVTSMPPRQCIAAFDLSLEACEADGRILLAMKYNTDLFASASIDRFMEDYEALLAGTVEDPECRLSRLPLKWGAGG